MVVTNHLLTEMILQVITSSAKLLGSITILSFGDWIPRDYIALVIVPYPFEYPSFWWREIQQKKLNMKAPTANRRPESLLPPFLKIQCKNPPPLPKKGPPPAIFEEVVVFLCWLKGVITLPNQTSCTFFHWETPQDSPIHLHQVRSSQNG